MKRIFPSLIACLALVTGSESSGQSTRRTVTSDEKIDSTFNHHLKIVSQYLQGRVSNASSPWQLSMHYLEKITDIPSSGDWTYFGKTGLRMEDIHEWAQWYNDNRQLLTWDDKLKVVKTNRDKADAEKYRQASNYILNQERIWKKESIKLSDTLVYIPVSDFYDELNKVRKYSHKNRALDSLKRLNLKRNFNPIQWIPENKSSFNEKSNMVLYFSKVYSNQLTAKAVDKKENSNKYKHIYILFEFDCDNRIKKTYFKEVNHN